MTPMTWMKIWIQKTLDEIENALPTSNNTNETNDIVLDGDDDDGGNADEDFNYDLDFSKTKKKYLEDLVADKLDDNREDGLGVGELHFVVQ